LLFIAVAVFLLGANTTFAAEAGPVVSPSDALQRLVEGNQRFVEGAPSHPENAALRLALAKGQAPFAIILGCSDSRTSPEILFDQGLGGLFVVRLAGNVADPIAIDSIDYAVKHLGARLVVVLGHTACGAVTAAVKSAGSQAHRSQLIKELLPAVIASRHESGDAVENAVIANVKLNVDLLKDSKALKEMVDSGEVEIVGGNYDLATGKVDWLSN
jgi:carbonic anhydrase